MRMSPSRSRPATCVDRLLGDVARRHHDPDGAATLAEVRDELLERGGGLPALLGERGARPLRAVPGVHLVAGVEQAVGHAGAHAPESDEARSSCADPRVRDVLERPLDRRLAGGQGNARQRESAAAQRAGVAQRLRVAQRTEAERAPGDRSRRPARPPATARTRRSAARPCGTGRSSAGSAARSRRVTAQPSASRMRPCSRSSLACALRRRRHERLQADVGAAAPRHAPSTSASEPASSTGSLPSRAKPSRIATVRSLASCTFGWSKGLMCSLAPTRAVAISHSTNSAPRSAAPSNCWVNTGCPAARSVFERGVLLVVAGPGGGGRRAGRRRRPRRRRAARPPSGSTPVPGLAGRLGDQLLEPQPDRGELRRDHERQLVAALARARSPITVASVPLGLTPKSSWHFASAARRAREQRRDVDAGEHGRARGRTP